MEIVSPIWYHHSLLDGHSGCPSALSAVWYLHSIHCEYAIGGCGRRPTRPVSLLTLPDIDTVSASADFSTRL
jgi:hypothetical protein